MRGYRLQSPIQISPVDPDFVRILLSFRESLRVKCDRPKRETSPVPFMARNPPPLKEHFAPTTYNSPSCIVLPNVAAAQYEIKPSTLNLLSSFHGFANEDPFNHIDEFLTVCSTLKIQNFSTDALKLLLFPFSLKDKAKHWLSTLPAQSISSWEQLQEAFLKKYFSAGKQVVFVEKFLLFPKLIMNNSTKLGRDSKT